ncbi:PAS domain S-box protein [Cellvibrio sp. KY-GH-1]|uniref:PAS domain S-box protein n=1 Tax=Cellvibrio sp. KY-GH-1 TaxID=2303332 RepID=UPI001246D925|nr:PAS domain S-box protein [Cellvibrio sp. KY-GH-1]QEY17246.1 PAS domain S-box protein [Cellvibrio sp. KY-GH-1]
MKAALPANEELRLQALYRLDVLDTPREKKFDAITHLAKNICDVPIAVISLVDRDRQWFKSCIGLDASETPRDVAFCAHAIFTPSEMLLVEDALLDRRFSDNPLVTGEPFIRFYAGAPLVTPGGEALGTLCVIDHQPRQLTHEQQCSLRLLADQVVQLFEAHESSIALQRERQHVEDIIRGANLGTWRWNVQTGETIFNERWAGILGYSLDELAPVSLNTWFTLCHPEDLKVSGELLERHFRGELDYYECNCRMRHKSGEWVYVYARGRVISFLPDGEPLWMSGTHTDITELHQSRIRLIQSEERLQSMINNFPGAVYRCRNDERWTMLYLSDAVTRLTGHAAKEFFGERPLSFTDITHPDDVTRIFDQVQQALRFQKSFNLVYRMQHSDGQWIYVQEVGAGVFDRQKGLKYIDGFLWDITETKAAYDEIALSEQKLSTLYTQAPIAITLNHCLGGNFIECNPEFCRLLGYSRSDVMRMDNHSITPPEYAQEDLEQLESLHISGRYGPYEKHLIHNDGRLIPVLLNGVLIESPNGERQIWSFIQDITERKRIEQMKNEFVSAVSHELRTPLTSISGSLGMVVGGMLGSLPANIHNMLTIAHKNSLRLTLLINDLLDMEKLLAGKMQFDLSTQLLLPILQQSVEGNMAYAETFGIRLTLLADAATENLEVDIDAQRLQQVMANFISNAVKFSPPNGQVEVVVTRSGNRVKIAVVDHGPGVSEEFRARIFQKFSQADSSDSRQRGGTGLGLAISKAFVERMQGTIGFDSELGKGATFYATFPLHSTSV